MVELFDMTPVKFYPYTSMVHQRVLSMDGNEETKKFKREMLRMFNGAGIKCQDDNKVVFEFEFNSKRIFYGFYDFRFFIGFSVTTR